MQLYECLLGVPKILKEMSFIAAIDPTSGLLHSYIDHRKKIIVGLCAVLPGYRIRAGELGAMWYQIDWCCAANQEKRTVLFSLLINYLEEGGDLYALPRMSRIKPYYYDFQFVQKLSILFKNPFLMAMYNSSIEIEAHNNNLNENI